MLRTCLLAAILVATRAMADSYDGLKIIDNPGGGQIVYGPLPGESTMPGAMGSMLRRVHTHFGDRPQVGKFFQAGGSDSIATFFTLKARSQMNDDMAGLAIVSAPRGGKPSGVVLYDQAARFSKNMPAMMQRLNEAWQSAPAGSPAVQPLRNYTGGDSSASIGLPAGWKITQVYGGSLHAEGPDNESIHLGLIVQNIYDPRNPKAQQMIDYLKKGRTPFIVCPNLTDLTASYLCVMQQSRNNQHLPAAAIHVASSRPAPASPYESSAEIVIADIDLNEGKGPVMSNIRIGVMKGSGANGGWAMTVSSESVPRRLVDQEWPTIMAMVASYRQNGKVIFAETQAVIDNIHANAAAAKARAEAFSAANDAHNRAVEATWDDQAKRNKAFENYQMDRTIVEDNQQNTHILTGYALGDLLVRTDPTRFRYVPTQDFLKGIDY